MIYTLQYAYQHSVDVVGNSQNILVITEYVRSHMARQISNADTSEAGYIPIVTLSAVWEQAFSEALVGQGDERQLAMAPSQLQDFMAQLQEGFEHQAMRGELPVLVTSPAIRPYVRSIIERFRPSTVVLSQNEIHAKARIFHKSCCCLMPVCSFNYSSSNSTKQKCW